MSSGVVRSTALRAGGACVRCRKGKTKCVYENGRAPCKNCAKGMHDCYLPSESMAHHHGQSPARHTNPHRPPRDSLPAAGPNGGAEARQAVVGSGAARHVQANSDNPQPAPTAVFAPRLTGSPPKISWSSSSFSPSPQAVRRAPPKRPAVWSTRPGLDLGRTGGCGQRHAESLPCSGSVLGARCLVLLLSAACCLACAREPEPGRRATYVDSPSPHLPPPLACAGLVLPAEDTCANPVASPLRLTPELIAECERVVSKTFPACVAFHKPSFVQQLKSASLDAALVYGLLTCAARSSPSLIRRYGGPTQAAETFAAKAIALINQNLDHPNLVDIQALCLIIIHEWGSRNAVRAYIYLGQAARMVQMYRILNSHHSSPDADQFLRDESLRRTIWLIYILDCLLTSTPGRYSALSPLDTSDVSLPCSDINFAFGNAVFVKTLRQQLDPTALPPGQAPSAEIGEFGYIVLASTIWRDVVAMLTTTTLVTFREEDCSDLITKIEGLRASLPMQFVDKPGQINLHMTMGSGYTFAMLHCLLHCATVFVHRRRLLQEVTAPSFNLETFRLNPRCHDIIDRLFTSCHGIISLLTAVEAGSEKDHIPCFPIFMLFSSFTSSATVAYLSLKGLTPPNAVETAAHIVKDGLRFMNDGTENWPLMGSWLRHLTVMQRVLNNDAGNTGSIRHSSISHGPSGIKDEISSNADTNPDAMDYDQQTNAGGSVSGQAQPRSVSESVREDSEPPTALPRRPGVTTINGGSGGISTPTVSPPPGSAPHSSLHSHDAKQQSPDMGTNGMVATQDGQTTSQDMTAPELCQAFERQLLDLDDLAAFMGGGV
ncbi:hypothetical protein QQX98_006107 [Neonectria punicea]|uniref:Zn(2)-C6 fungal-type domain-containing protein n=1 Tax=Neonectria punicea TaxID=979145 RepID=A0ABR1H225_9HYPO